MQIHGKEYAEVKDRIKEFRKNYPGWSIYTSMPFHAEDMSWCVFQAIIYDDQNATTRKQQFTGWAYEERTTDSKQVNFTSWVENCETSAIGRALANMDIQLSENRPSAEEMQKVERMKATTSTEKPATTQNKPSFIRTKKPHENTSEVDSVKRDIMHIKGALTMIMGHDQAFQQALMNRNIESLEDTIPLAELKELRESLSTFSLYVEDRIEEVTKERGKKLKEVADDERAPLEEAFKKMTMML